jgi:hypothetical protein
VKRCKHQALVSFVLCELPVKWPALASRATCNVNEEQDPEGVDVAGVAEVAKEAADEAAFTPPGVMNTLAAITAMPLAQGLLL